MNKENYITLLTNYVNKQEISLYDYFFKLANQMKNNHNGEGFPEWEQYNPFLKQEDYHKLFTSKEEDICRYFALAMEKTITLNLNGEVKDDVVAEESLSREDIESVINDKMNEDDESLSREDIESVINDKMSEDILSREDIESIISEKMNEDNNTLSREDIESAINDKMNENNSLSREDIESVINDKMNNDTLGREDIKNVINEAQENDQDIQVEYSENNSSSTIRNFVMTIGKKISNFLNGFAVLKNEEKNTTDVYYYDAKEKKVSNKQTFESDKLKADSGIYVNYQEYIDRMFESVLDKYPDADSITFINDEGEEKAFAEVVEEAYGMLREAGSLRFGNELAKKQPKTYQEYTELDLEGDSYYGDALLQKGIYVRRDLLNEFFSHYYVRALYYEYYDEEEKEIVK